MKISVCTWQSCKGRFSEYIITRLKNDKERFNLSSLIIEENPCIWNCHAWPSILVDGDVRPYMNPAKASVIAMNNWWTGKKKKKKRKTPQTSIKKNEVNLENPKKTEASKNNKSVENNNKNN